jgi:hypothetical protein
VYDLATPEKLVFVNPLSIDTCPGGTGVQVNPIEKLAAEPNVSTGVTEPAAIGNVFDFVPTTVPPESLLACT